MGTTEQVETKYNELAKLYHRDIVNQLLRLNPFGGYVATGKQKDKHQDILVLLRYEFGPKLVKEWRQG